MRTWALQLKNQQSWTWAQSNVDVRTVTAWNVSVPSDWLGSLTAAFNQHLSVPHLLITPVRKWWRSVCQCRVVKEEVRSSLAHCMLCRSVGLWRKWCVECSYKVVVKPAKKPLCSTTHLKQRMKRKPAVLWKRCCFKDGGCSYQRDQGRIPNPQPTCQCCCITGPYGIYSNLRPLSFSGELTFVFSYLRTL